MKYSKIDLLRIMVKHSNLVRFTFEEDTTSIKERGYIANAVIEDLKWDLPIDLSEIVITNSRFINCVFRDVNLSESILTYNMFESCKFIDCTFTSATFSDSQFEDCVFKRCDLEGANFLETELEDTYIKKSCNISHMIGNAVQIHTIQTPYFPVVVTPERIVVGCKDYSFKFWKKFAKGDKELFVGTIGQWMHKEYAKVLIPLVKRMYKTFKEDEISLCKPYGW